MDRTVRRRPKLFMSLLLNRVRRVCRSLRMVQTCKPFAVLCCGDTETFAKANRLKNLLRSGSTSECTLHKLLARCGRWLGKCLALHSRIRARFFVPALNSLPQGVAAAWRLGCTSPTVDNESSYPCNTELADSSRCRVVPALKKQGFHCNVHDLHKTNR